MSTADAAQAVATAAIRWLGAPAGSPDATEVPAVASAVVRWAVELDLAPDPDAPDIDDWWNDTSTTAAFLGLVMLTARLVRRRNSPGGIEGFGADGGASYVRKNDPDVAMMLGLDGYRRLVVG